MSNLRLCAAKLRLMSRACILLLYVEGGRAYKSYDCVYYYACALECYIKRSLWIQEDYILAVQLNYHVILVLQLLLLDEQTQLLNNIMY